MIILSDCDGVLADFMAGVCAGLAERGFARSAEDVKHFELAASFAPDEMRAVAQIMGAPGWCQALAWYDGAREFLRSLAHEGEVHAVTAPYRNSPTWMHERLAWLSAELPGDRVHFVSGKYKHLVRGDVLIEDHPRTAHDWLEAHPSGISILIDRPWNSPQAQEFWPHSRMFRVRSYDEALQALKECA